MSKEKQIEEMARTMCRNYTPNGSCAADDDTCQLECIYGYCAERIYCAGYRKQSERYLVKENGDIVPLAARSEWIAVKERLPEKVSDYLCRCVIKDNYDYPFFMVLRYILIDENPHFQHECTDGLHVTHWMPLPEPPKGE